MWHPLSRVAEHRRLDPHSFIEFAKQNRERFHLNDYESDDPLVHTWWEDDLVKEFKAKVSSEVIDK